jgi:hypothetical protein
MTQSSGCYSALICGAIWGICGKLIVSETSAQLLGDYSASSKFTSFYYHQGIVILNAAKNSWLLNHFEVEEPEMHPAPA